MTETYNAVTVAGSHDVVGKEIVLYRLSKHLATNQKVSELIEKLKLRTENTSDSSSLPSRGGSSNGGSQINFDSPPTSPPFACDDRACCFGGPGGPLCNPVGLHVCPGLPGAIMAPSTVNGTGHPVSVCTNCVQHDNTAPNTQNDINAYAGFSVWPFGHKAQLCHDCTKGDMELYWLRRGTPQPAAPPSIPLVANWPVALGGLQNLCICTEKGLSKYYVLELYLDAKEDLRRCRRFSTYYYYFRADCFTCSGRSS
jgi:hypothetical protein